MSAGRSRGWSFDERRYAPVHARQPHSPTLCRIWGDAYGADYSPDVSPLGFSTLTDLERLASLLAIDVGDTLVDLGCGGGGPGLWLAERTGASLVGIDVVPEAIELAEQRREAFDLGGGASFHVGSMVATGLAATSFDAAVSVDALWMVLDKQAALSEAARIVKPGGRFALTTWEPAYFDHRNLLEDAGFSVVAREEPARWRDRQLAVYQGVLDEEPALRAELGDEAMVVLLAEATAVPALLAEQTRLIVVSERRP